MSYSVFFSAETESNLEQTYLYYLERSRQGAIRWFQAYERAVRMVQSDPQRFAVERENDRFDVKLQQINFGTKLSHPTHRLLFYIEDRTVYIVTLRHLHQSDWQGEITGVEFE